eukprot:TRINITY_DN21006_c0_g1_i1.p1 TRINITY_DN21006_c0_g1~~TRINITY_DN21006_c0_g1_i1.p1  ORF type:complete len:182 (+),score=37.96 TRINITY_DN21006_c0_g1_i1:22-546(+)
MNLPFFVLFLFLIAIWTTAAVEGNKNICVICPLDELRRPNYYVDSHGTTCSQKFIEVAEKYANGTAACEQQTRAYKTMCCGPNTPPPIPQVHPTPDPTPKVVGPYPVCHICADGGPVTNKHMVINLGPIGAGTCESYQLAGLEGKIQPNDCSALHYYAKAPCGCGNGTRVDRQV